jgi:hypothetical protein
VIKITGIIKGLTFFGCLTVNIDTSLVLPIIGIFISIVASIGWSGSALGEKLERKAEITVSALIGGSVDKKEYNSIHMRHHISVDKHVVSTDLSATDKSMHPV